MEKDTLWIHIIFVLFSLVYFCQGMYSVHAPSTHMAFSNKSITVNYTLAEENVSIIILEWIDIDTNQSLHRTSVSSPSVSGTTSYPCSIFSNESRLIVLLLDDNETVVAQSNILRVEPPSIGVVMPSPQVYTLNGPVEVSIFMNLDDGLCSSCELLFFAIYRRYNDNKSEQIKIYSKPIDYEVELKLSLECEYLDTAGFYNFLVTTKAGRILGNSAIMEVLWNKQYSVYVQSQSISKCPDNGLFIDHQAPVCGSGKFNDKIRVYAQIGSYSAIPGPIGSMDYVLEVDMPDTGNVNTIACSNFHQHYTNYHGYCFFYVSVTRTGSVHEQAHMCIPYFSSDIAIAGGWSGWGEWSSCTASCGDGSRHRTRACENPAPTNGGLPCVGAYVKTGTCNDIVCPTVIVSKEQPVEEEYNDACRCGCVLERTFGTIDAYDENCRSHVTWLVRVDQGYRVNMTFKSFDLSSSGRYQEYLRIRDGQGSDAPILLFVTGTRLPVPLLSTGETMFMEYKIYRSNSYRHGFLASFNSTKKKKVPTATLR